MKQNMKTTKGKEGRKKGREIKENKQKYETKKNMNKWKQDIKEENKTQVKR